jgi:AbiU2
VHTVLVGGDAEKYARDWLERDNRAQHPASSFLIERDSGRVRGNMVGRTAEDAKKANIEKMGELLGTLFSGLWQDVATRYFYWKEYVTLFGTKPERIALLNRAAPFIFRTIQDELWESTLLSLARLTDPSNSQGNPDRSNLTIQALPALIVDAKLKAEVEKLVAEAVKLTEFCRDWRNRRIAHRDLKLALGDSTKPLANGSRRR